MFSPGDELKLLLQKDEDDRDCDGSEDDYFAEVVVPVINECKAVESKAAHADPISYAAKARLLCGRDSDRKRRRAAAVPQSFLSSFKSLGAVDKVFQEMIAKEKELCDEYIVFYHCYNQVIMVYELNSIYLRASFSIKIRYFLRCLGFSEGLLTSIRA